MMKSAVMAGFGLALRLNVDRSDVRGIFYETQRRLSRNNDRVARILARVSLRSCRRDLVIAMFRHCGVRQFYGRGESDLGGGVGTC